MIRQKAAQPGADVVLAEHRMVRDGSFWICMHCPQRRPFGGGMPDLTDVPCVPRQWGDGL